MKSLQIAIAVISEGETEGWYLRQMRTSERINFDIFPKEGKNISGLQKKLIELLKDDLYDYIFCLIDMDTKENPTERQKFDELVNKFKMNKNVYFLKSQPCFEYWFFLHKSKYSGRFFKTWENIEPLKPEIKKIIPGYEKSKKFYYSHSGQGLYEKLRAKLFFAARNSLKLKNENKFHYCELFTLIGLIFCRKINTSSKKDFFQCIEENSLCDKLKKYFCDLRV